MHVESELGQPSRTVRMDLDRHSTQVAAFDRHVDGPALGLLGFRLP